MANRTLDRYDNMSARPWPVSPFKYPLTGPSRGPVCVPSPPDGDREKYAPPRAEWETNGGFPRLLATLAALAGYMFGVGLLGYLIATTYFK